MAPFSLLHEQNVAPGFILGFGEVRLKPWGKVVPSGQAVDMQDSVVTGKTKQEQVPQCVKHCANASQENAIGLRLSGDQAPPAKPGLRDSPENSFAFHQNSLGCRGEARSATPAL
jgi:hypothetical protein